MSGRGGAPCESRADAFQVGVPAAGPGAGGRGNVSQAHVSSAARVQYMPVPPGQGFQKGPVPLTRIPLPGCTQQWGSPNCSPWAPVLPSYGQT